MRSLGTLAMSAALSLAWVAAAHAQQSGNATTATPPASGAMGPGMHGGAGMGPHMGRGAMGPGMRGGPGDTAGWSMMSPDERRQHHAKMTSFTRAKACRVYVDQHHRLMAERAKQRGVNMPSAPMHDPCAGLPE